MKKKYSTISHPNINFTTSWDDYKTINKALDINKNDTLITLSGAGDNVLNFLLKNPKKIVSIDNNISQNYLLKLKITGIKFLSYDEYLKLIAVKKSKNRKKIYHSIRSKLDKKPKSFWDKNIDFIDEGITYNGKAERPIKFYGKYLRFIKNENKIKKIFTFENIDNQAKYFNQNINDFSFNLLFYFLYSRIIFKIKLSFRLIHDFFRGEYVPEHDFEFIKNVAYSKQYLNKIKKQFTNLKTKNNYFLSLFLFGYYVNKDCYPPYLKKENFNILKERVGNIEILTKDFLKALEDFPTNSINKFNLSNLPDWISNKDFEILLKKLNLVGKNGSRFCYFSTRVDRKLNKNIDFIISEHETAKRLFKNSRVWDYGNFEIGVIYKKSNK